jgi:uncharacterized protein YjbI with pentapeptide repeats
MREANLTGADLRNMDMRSSDLNDTNINDVIWGNTICPDGTNSDASPLHTCAANLTP